MDMDICKIIVVGHVDHGKSTLIGCLLRDTRSLPDDVILQAQRAAGQSGHEFELPFITDQLKEERDRKMTMDTTHFFLRDRAKRYVIIDAPGHEELLKNMFSGITQADAAVIVIAVNEGLKKQTRRHTFLLKMLNFQNIIVVVNKMDLVNYSETVFDKIKMELLEIFQELKLKVLDIIPISALHGIHIKKRSDQMKWFNGYPLLDAIRSINTICEVEKKSLRFCVQDVYNINDQQILVGRVISGCIKRGQKVLLLPSLEKIKIRDIKIYKGYKLQAQAGENIGIILEKPLAISRGTIIVQANTDVRPINRFQAYLFWLSPNSLNIEETCNLRCVTQAVHCVIEDISKRINIGELAVIEENAKSLNSNEVGALTLKTDKPIVVENFSALPEMGRFVIEKNDAIQGAGIIVDTHSF